MRAGLLFNSWTPDSPLSVGALNKTVMVPTALGIAAVCAFNFAEPSIRQGINTNVKNPTAKGLLHMGLDIIDGKGMSGGGN